MRPKHKLNKIAIVVGAVCLVYFLSIGPAIRIYANHRVLGPILIKFYAPITYLQFHTVLRYPIGWYIGLWIPDNMLGHIKPIGR